MRVRITLRAPNGYVLIKYYDLTEDELANAYKRKEYKHYGLGELQIESITELDE